MATTKTTGKRRGRPKKADQKVSQYAGTVSNAIRESVRSYIGVCESCGHNIRPVQPVAKEIGISPAILSRFIRGEAGVSMSTLDMLAGYVDAHQNDPLPDATEVAEAEVEGEAVTA